MPEQRSKPEAEPDLLMRKERAARCGLITHIPGVLRSAERSPFMSPQRPTARDFSSCGATTSTKTPLDKTVMPCSGTWTETTPSWNIMTIAAILVEVVAPQLLKSRAVGLCGDMNGERSADLKTPGMCVMRPHLAALSYLINKSGSASGFERCSGIP